MVRPCVTMDCKYLLARNNVIKNKIKAAGFYIDSADEDQIYSLHCLYFYEVRNRGDV